MQEKNMQDISITLNWLKPGPVSLEGLDDFFKDHGDKEGIYFWIYKGKPERITYIGQTTQGFQKRFQDHISLFLHGLRRAVDVSEPDTDWLKVYYNWLEKCGKNEVNNKKVYEPLMYVGYNIVDMENHVKKIMDGINKSIKYLKKLRFLFVEVGIDEKEFNKINHKKHNIFKHIESFFTLLLLFNSRKECDKFNIEEYKDYLTISEYPKKYYRYKIDNKIDNKDDIYKIIEDELGLLRVKEWALWYNEDEEILNNNIKIISKT